MTLEEAIKTAIEFETRVHAAYQEAARKATDPVGKRIFSVLAGEEQGHIDYLQSRLEEWRSTGALSVEELRTAVPAHERIADQSQQLKQKVTPDTSRASNEEIELLQKAIEAEQQTSGFYKKVASELSGEGQQLFARFVEIEEGHLAIVQAEMDSVQGLGFWFDMQEFQLDAG